MSSLLAKEDKERKTFAMKSKITNAKTIETIPSVPKTKKPRESPSSKKANAIIEKKKLAETHRFRKDPSFVQREYKRKRAKERSKRMKGTMDHLVKDSNAVRIVKRIVERQKLIRSHRLFSFQVKAIKRAKRRVTKQRAAERR